MALRTWETHLTAIMNGPWWPSPLVFGVSSISFKWKLPFCPTMDTDNRRTWNAWGQTHKQSSRQESAALQSVRKSSTQHSSVTQDSKPWEASNLRICLIIKAVCYIDAIFHESLLSYKRELFNYHLCAYSNTIFQISVLYTSIQFIQPLIMSSGDMDFMVWECKNSPTLKRHHLSSMSSG